MITKLFRKRNIPVKFVDYPGAKVDTSLFDKSLFETIKKNGIDLSPITIIHSAGVHYGGRYRTSLPGRLANAYIDIVPSISKFGDGGLYLSDHESNEFQTKSTEVLAVGICISLSTRLFSINTNKISLIEGSGKRCDFSIIKGNQEYYIESKGRKGYISAAINDIFLKKASYKSVIPKYGVVSRLPRDDNKATVTVVDPDFIPKDIDDNEQVRRLLFRYSKIAYLSGFKRLGDLLAKRYQTISNGVNFTELNETPLDHENTLKTGTSVEINIGNTNYEAFYQGAKEFQFENNSYNSLYLMERNLIELLERQDLFGLLEYHQPEDVAMNEERSVFSILSDGSLLAYLTIESFENLNSQ